MLRRKVIFSNQVFVAQKSYCEAFCLYEGRVMGRKRDGLKSVAANAVLGQRKEKEP